MTLDARRKLIHEFKATFYRWEQESDLTDCEILDCVKSAIDEYYDTEIDFDSEIDLEEDEG